MSRHFETTGAPFLRVLSSPLPATGVPCTLAFWGRRSDLTGTGPKFVIGTASTTVNAFELSCNSTGGVTALTRSSAGSSSNAATANLWLDASGWHHACGVYASGSSRVAYFDGGNSASNAVARNVTALNRVVIGAGPTGVSQSSGWMSNVAVWNVALTDGEVLMLGLGVSPRLVRRDALVFYVPRLGLVGGDTEVDTVGGLIMTPNGTWNWGAQDAEEPPNFYVDRRPHSPRFFLMSPPPASAGLMGQACL